MTQCDFVLWGLIEDRVFVSLMPQDLVELREWVIGAFPTVTGDMLIPVQEEIEYRLDICRVKKGAYIESL